MSSILMCILLVVFEEYGQIQLVRVEIGLEPRCELTAVYDSMLLKMPGMVPTMK